MWPINYKARDRVLYATSLQLTVPPITKGTWGPILFWESSDQLCLIQNWIHFETLYRLVLITGRGRTSGAIRHSNRNDAFYYWSLLINQWI